MKLGEVCLLTGDVVRLANFYKVLLGVDNGVNDEVHQFILTEETSLTIYNDGIPRENAARGVCIAFTVEDVDREFERLKAMGVEIIAPPTLRPWGAKNMVFRDPDGNPVAFRSFAKKAQS